MKGEVRSSQLRGRQALWRRKMGSRGLGLCWLCRDVAPHSLNTSSVFTHYQAASESSLAQGQRSGAVYGVRFLSSPGSSESHGFHETELGPVSFTAVTRKTRKTHGKHPSTSWGDM